MYERFRRLCEEQGVCAADVAKATGITKSTFYEWKAGKYEPKTGKLIKIADFFGVSLDYLCRGPHTGASALEAPSQIPGQQEMQI